MRLFRQVDIQKLLMGVQNLNNPRYSLVRFVVVDNLINDFRRLILIELSKSINFYFCGFNDNAVEIKKNGC